MSAIIINDDKTMTCARCGKHVKPDSVGAYICCGFIMVPITALFPGENKTKPPPSTIDICVNIIDSTHSNVRAAIRSKTDIMVTVQPIEILMDHLEIETIGSLRNITNKP